MKAFTIAMVLIITFALLAFVRADHDTDLRRILPFLGGQRICIYDFAGAVVVLTSTWAIGRLLWRARSAEDSTTSSQKGSWRFRWSLLAVVILVLVTVWIAEAAHPAFQWTDLLRGLHIRNRERFTQLATLCLLCVSALLIVRVATAGLGDEDD